MRPAPPPVSAGDGTPSEIQQGRTDPPRPSEWDSDLRPAAPEASRSASAPRSHRSTRGGVPWPELAALAVLLAAIVVPVVLLGGPSQTTAGSAPSPVGVPRTVFQFDPPPVSISALGPNQAAPAAGAAAESIRSALSTFYDQAFVNPATWTRGVPSAAWDLFTPDLRARAEQDVSSLGLGAQVPTLSSLSVTQASLSVRVLVDPRGAIEAVGVEVRFVAGGELKDGRSLQLTNKASFLFQQVSGRWLIVGYPLASTEVNAVAPSPSPTPSGASPTASASGGTP